MVSFTVWLIRWRICCLVGFLVDFLAGSLGWTCRRTLVPTLGRIRGKLMVVFWFVDGNFDTCTYKINHFSTGFGVLTLFLCRSFREHSILLQPQYLPPFPTDNLSQIILSKLRLEPITWLWTLVTF